MLLPDILRLKFGKSAVTRCVAASRLAKSERRGGMRALVLAQALHDADRYVRQNAAGALGKIGGRRAVEPLASALRDPDPGVRRYAAESLGEIGDVRAIGPLAAVLTDGNSQVRTKAAEALGKLPCLESLSSLVKAISDRGAIDWHAVAGSLGKLASDDGSTTTSRSGVHGPEAAEFWLRALRDGNQDVRVAALTALGRIGGVFEPLVELLRDGNPDVRSAAARALGSSKNPAAIDLLIPLLRDKMGFVRQGAAEGLGTISGPRAAAALVDLLRRAEWLTQQDWMPRHNLVPPLVRCGADAVEPLQAAYPVLAFGPRIVAADALGKIGDVRSVPFFLNLLHGNGSDFSNNYSRPPAIDGLRLILGRAAASVPAQSLRQIALLRQVSFWYEDTADSGHPITVPKAIDCTDIARLAQRELNRRKAK